MFFIHGSQLRQEPFKSLHLTQELLELMLTGSNNDVGGVGFKGFSIWND